MNYLGWQLDYLILLQNFRELSGHIFDNFFLNISLFGETSIPLFLICLIYWCINKEAGIYIMLNYILGLLLNLFLKCTFCIYRPWFFNSGIIPVEQSISPSIGYSFPSGHTSAAITTWGSIIVKFRKYKFIVWISVLIIFLVMFSRNYLGVHTPQDVIASFIAGILILVFMYKLFEWEKKSKNRDLIIFVSIAFICLFIFLYINFKPYPLDYINGRLIFNPSVVKEEVYYNAGWCIGIFLGWLIEKRYINFNPEAGTIVDKILRLAIGSLIVFCLLSVHTNSKLLIYTISFLNGFFISAVYPLIIKLFDKK